MEYYDLKFHYNNVTLRDTTQTILETIFFFGKSIFKSPSGFKALEID